MNVKITIDKLSHGEVAYQTPSCQVLKLKLAHFVLISNVTPPVITEEDENWD